MAKDTKAINYARDDVFIISINNSADRIEECEAQIYTNPLNIFTYYGLVSALYSKIHKYLSCSEDINEELNIIRRSLFNNNILENIKYRTIDNSVKKSFLSTLVKLVSLYRKITEELPDTGLFPKPIIKDDRPGAVRNM